MLSYEEAYARITAFINPLPAQRVPIYQALGLVVAEDVKASVPLPPFANSAMDGFAVRHADASAELTIVDVIRAGEPSNRLIEPGEAAQIMTGAMIPDGADTVIPVEDSTVDGDRLRINEYGDQGQFIRPAGEDVASGAVVVPKGTVISPGVVGMLAAVGRATVKTHRRPKVSIVTTGDELVAPGSTLDRGQIYDSNGFSIGAQITEAGATVGKRLHAVDSRESIRSALEAASGSDIVITSGGVSVGEFDYVKEVFSERGSIEFWSVAIRPGKPFAFGRMFGADASSTTGSSSTLAKDDRVQEMLFFGLPGNPVSTMVTFELFVRPVCRIMLGDPRPRRTIIRARLLETISHAPGRRTFARVRVTQESGEFVARPAGGQGSGQIHAMVSANGLLPIPENAPGINAGESTDIWVIAPNAL